MNAPAIFTAMLPEHILLAAMLVLIALEIVTPARRPAAVVRAARLRRAVFVNRYHAECGHASTGLSAR